MKIAVLGTGRIGSILGKRWAAAGHDVVWGTRDPAGADVRALCAEAGASAAPVLEAAQGADVVVLALPHAAVAEVVPACGDLAGKVLIDCTNAVGAGYVPDLGGAESGAAQVAAMAPGARVVKAFNTLGNDVLEALDPGATEGRPDAFVAGDTSTREVVAELARGLGMTMLYVGPLEAAPLVEHVALLWITLSYRGGYGRRFVIETRQLD
jgi:predicted dinucleotide-binding enzyme